MTSVEMIAELLSCFPAPPERVQNKMRDLADTIQADARQDIVDKILETETASTKISIKHIIDACKALGVGYREAHYLPATDWVCDACGREFKYHPAPSDDERIDKDIHDVCPDCGFQPIWTIERSMYIDMNGWRASAEKIYQSHIQKAIQKYGRYDREYPDRQGLYFTREKAIAERKEGAKKRIDDKIAELDRAKRWDIEGE